MKKVLSIILAVSVICSLLLCGCNSKDNNASSESTVNAAVETTKTVTEKPVVLKVNYPVDPTVKEQVDLFKLIVSKFNEKYPNIQVINVVTSGSGVLNKASDLILLNAAGNAPDAVRLAATEATLVMSKGMVTDITDKINGWSFKDSINPIAYDYISQNGKIYGIPNDGYGHALMYNKKIFADLGIAAPPKTWDELIADAVKAKGAGKTGFAMITKDFFPAWLYVLPFVWQAGGDFESVSGNSAKAIFNSPEAMKAWQMIYDLKWKHDVIQKDVIYDAGAMMKDFGTGNVAMTVAWNPDAKDYVNNYGMSRDDIGFAPLPAGPAGEATLLGGSFWAVNSTSSQEIQEASWKFISWLTDSFLSDVEGAKSTITKLSAGLKEGQLATSSPNYSIFAGSIADAIVKVYKDNEKVCYIVPEDVTKQITEKGHPEPPYFTQQLYAEYFPQMVQQIVSDKNINLQKLADDNVASFQSKYLDTLK